MSWSADRQPGASQGPYRSCGRSRETEAETLGEELRPRPREASRRVDERPRPRPRTAVTRHRSRAALGPWTNSPLPALKGKRRRLSCSCKSCTSPSGHIWGAGSSGRKPQDRARRPWGTWELTKNGLKIPSEHKRTGTPPSDTQPSAGPFTGLRFQTRVDGLSPGLEVPQGWGGPLPQTRTWCLGAAAQAAAEPGRGPGARGPWSHGTPRASPSRRGHSPHPTL